MLLLLLVEIGNCSSVHENVPAAVPTSAARLKKKSGRMRMNWVELNGTCQLWRGIKVLICLIDVDAHLLSCSLFSTKQLILVEVNQRECNR